MDTEHAMRCWFVVAFLAASLVSGAACAGSQISTFTDPAQFAAATSALEMVAEDFEAADVAPSTTVSIASPLSHATVNATFPAGAITPGVEIHNVGAPADIRVLGMGSEYFSIGPAPSKLIAAESDANAFDLLFSPPVTAVGLRAFSESDGVGISYFGSAGLIAAMPVAAPNQSGGFIGIVSSEPIVRVRINAPNIFETGNFEGFDDLSYDRPTVVFSNGFEAPVGE